MEDDSVYLALKAKVKSASRALMDEPDWAANIEIVDLLNDNPQYIPHVARVLKKRIRHWNPNVGLLALHLVEALVKNCPQFRPHVTELDFVDSMLKELYRKKEKKTVLQHLQLQQQNVSEVSRLQRRDKVLLMIESWAKSVSKKTDAFEIYRITYEDLLRQGFNFPAPLKDEVSPVFTPAAKPRVLPETDTTGPVKDYGLQNDLATIELFMDTLNETKPNENILANDVVQTLKTSLENSQKDIIKRIGEDPSEELMAELLIVNDEICQALEFYDKVRTGKVKTRPQNGNKKPRAKGQRVSVVQQQQAYVDILGLSPVSTIQQSPPYESESEEESDDDESNDDDDQQKQRPKQLQSSNSSSNEVPVSNELVLASKALAPPRSNAKSRNVQKTIMVDGATSDVFSANSPSVEKDPFDVFQPSPRPNDINGAPLTGDALLNALVSTTKKPPQQKPDLNIFDPL